MRQTRHIKKEAEKAIKATFEGHVPLSRLSGIGGSERDREREVETEQHGVSMGLGNREGAREHSDLALCL